jgi:hypoxanthine phosphoribosyltransferase
MNEQPLVLFPRERIDERVRELGAAIGECFAGHELCVVGLMKNSLIFMADLIRAIPLELTCHFLQTSWLRELGAGSARTDIVYSTDMHYESRHVLLVVDIVDTGITLNFLMDHIREQRPAQLKVCALIDKPADRKVEVHPDWSAFTLTEPLGRFVVGYGLDFQERFRGLPFIGTISIPSSAPEARKIPPAPGASA